MADVKPQRIDNIIAGLMIFTALIFDVLSIIPWVNIITDIAAILLFGLWFMLLGVGFMNPRRIATWATAGIIEAIPILSILPGITVGVAATIFMVKLEDKTGLKIPGKVGGGGKLPTPSKPTPPRPTPRPPAPQRAPAPAPKPQ